MGPARGVMTWRGTLVYYAIGILVASVFVALAYYLPSAASWGADGRYAAGALLVYGMALVSGLPAGLAYAFGLRRVAVLLRLERLLQWLAAGAALGLAVPWIFARLGYFVEGTYFTAEWQWLKPAVMFPFIGPIMYQTQPVWVRLIVGVATALVLYQTARRLSTPRSPGTHQTRRRATSA